jgi:hypothetical protein
MSDTTTTFVTAPNGRKYRFHRSGSALNKGFVYVWGRRVYGTFSYIDHTFTPKGKWAFIVGANTATVQPEPETAAV